MDISLNLIDVTIAENLYESKSFSEFCSDLDELKDLFSNDLFSEAVGHQKMGVYHDASTIYQNTKDSIKATKDVYRSTTDAGGSMLAALWKVVMSAFKLIARVAKFICTHIDKIPLMISQLIDKIADIPSDIKNKIKGNIKLYITADDIVSMYSIQTGSKVKGRDDISLFARLDMMIIDLEKLIQGNLWTTYFTDKKSPLDFFRQFGKDFVDKDTKGETDIAIINRITKQYNYIQNLTFDPTVIDMNNAATVEIYFGTKNKLQYKDHRGNGYNCTYLEALKEMLQYIIDKKSIIKELQKSLDNKMIETQNNSEFAKLGTSARNTITEFFKTVSKLIEILGNLTRYITADIHTIEKSANQIKASATRYRKGDLSEEEKKAIKSDAKKYYNHHPIRRAKDKINKQMDDVNDKIDSKTLDVSKKELKNRDKIMLREIKRVHKNKIDELEGKGWIFRVTDGEFYGLDPDLGDWKKINIKKV